METGNRLYTPFRGATAIARKRTHHLLLAAAVAALALPSAGCAFLVNTSAATAPLQQHTLGACIDRSKSMSQAAITQALHAWAAEVTTAGGRASTGTTELTFYTGFIGPDSYRHGFDLLPSIVVRPAPPRPTNPYDTHATKAWRNALDHVRQTVRRAAERVRSFQPPRELGTDLEGCILKAHQLGVTKLFLATDLQPWGAQQTASLDLSGDEVALLFFCHSNQEAICASRRQRWVSRFEDAGTVSVHTIDPAQIGGSNGLF